MGFQLDFYGVFIRLHVYYGVFIRLHQTYSLEYIHWNFNRFLLDIYRLVIREFGLISNGFLLGFYGLVMGIWNNNVYGIPIGYV